LKELFGIPTSSILIVLLCLFAAALATVAFIALRNRTMFTMGIRNLPRRGTQTLLVVFGLTLSTLIVTAAFVTGDTIDHSLTKGSYDLLGRSDIDISWNGERDFGSDAGAATAGEQALLNQSVVASLESHFVGDVEIAGFLPSLYVQAAVKNQRSGLATPVAELTGFDPVRLERLGGLHLGSGGSAPITSTRPDEVWVGERTARELDARQGDVLTVFAPLGARDFRVAGIVRDELASGFLGLAYSTAPGGVAMPLVSLQALLGQDEPRISHLTVALKGDVRSTAKVAEAPRKRIEAFVQGDGVVLFGEGSGLDAGRQVEVFKAKQDLVTDAEMTGNLFTTFFLVLGLFSMAAGVMLIFMIFVMLASERRAEMGMARAVGAQRRHLIQSFIAEGMAYSLLAGIFGVLAGIGASYGLTNVLLPAVGGEYFSIVEASYTPTSIAIGYSLGVVITFITVVFASLKVTHVNIVAAIRDLPDQRRPEPKRKTRWRWVVLGVPALVFPPVGLWFVLRKGLGLPWVWIFAPLGIVAGGALMALGKSSETLFFFALGISLLPLCAAGIARRLGVPNRGAWTTVGLILIAYWLMPPSQHDRLFGEFKSNLEMFVLSGVMICIAATLIIVFNARVLTTLFAGRGNGRKSYFVPATLFAGALAAAAIGLKSGDRGQGLGQLFFLLAGLLVPVALLSWASIRIPSLAPALKMAVAYPLSNRFRTGMTIAMFSLIVFSLTVFSVLLSNFSALEGGKAARGGVDIIGTTNSASQAGEFENALTGVASPVASQLAAVGRTSLYTGSQEVRQAGLPAHANACPEAREREGFCHFPVLAADAAFFSNLGPTLEFRAMGYETDSAVLQAVAKGKGALINRAVTPSGFGDYDFKVQDVDFKDHKFQPFEIEYRDTATGNSATVTVLGVLRIGLVDTKVGGLYLNEPNYTQTFGQPRYQRLFIRAAEGADSRKVARGIESALATSGVEADSVQKLLDDAQAQNVAFNRMFQSFMALGLLVGIAGLGVIAFRSVVERRQQIGMLRAIGYQRGTVSLTFLLESSFIAAMGILSGVIGGAILGRNLLTSESFTGGASLDFSLPWPEIIGIIALSFAFSLAMTWWPGRGAARVPVAEALRYE
jgi:putative ABC transport system permease protein